MNWLNRVPPGTTLCLQSTDMEHSEHLFGVRSLQEFQSQMRDYVDIEYAGEMTFQYPHMSFSRYMVIGRRSESMIKA